jgi:hypothetical protein
MSLNFREGVLSIESEPEDLPSAFYYMNDGKVHDLFVMQTNHGLFLFY